MSPGNGDFNVVISLVREVSGVVYRKVLARDASAQDHGVRSERTLVVQSEVGLGSMAAWNPLRAALLEVEFIDNQTMDELLSINEGDERVLAEICDAVASALIQDLRRNS